jgi:glycosyltransferase involved in cell wall biosynthesis
MRILVLSPTFLPALGGAELVLLQVYRRLATTHTVKLLTPRLDQKLLDERGSDEYDPLVNFDVKRYTDRWSFMKIRGHRMTLGAIPPFSLSAVGEARKAAEDFDPDVVNLHYVMPTGLAGVYVEKKLGIPTVVTYNGRDVPGPGIPHFWRGWHRWVGRSCTDMTFVSRYCRDVIFGSDSEEGHVIPNGVDKPVGVTREDVAELRRKLGIKDEERVLFALQRLDSLKRVDVIIRSLPGVLSEHPKTRLLIGGKGSDLARLKDCVHELGLGEKVVFAGFLPKEDLPIYYGLADLFVFHSTYETFGMVLAEAMSYGKPVVSVSSTAIPSVVDHGQTGWLVPPMNSSAMAEAVNRLLKDPDLRRDIGQQGRKQAESTFDWDHIAESYENVLLEASSRRSR